MDMGDFVGLYSYPHVRLFFAMFLRKIFKDGRPKIARESIKFLRMVALKNMTNFSTIQKILRMAVLKKGKKFSKKK